MKSAHLKGGKGQRPHQNKMEGKKTEGDQYFMYNMAILVGSPCEVTVRETIEGGPRKRYDGIFAAYTSERHEILIEAAHRVEEGADDEAPITEHYDMLVVPTDKMLTARFKSVDTHYATRDFTDQAIASSRGSLSREKELKELTPWDGPEVGSDEDLSLDAGLSNSKMKENGWEAKDMFKKNEEKYGVTSSFKNDLSGYTTQLDKSDIDAFKRAEHQASQIAQEIEKNTVSWERSELENGEDEEEVFSAVVRPSRNSAGHSNLNNNNNNNNNSSSTSGNDKYIPPSRRQGNIQSSTQSLPPPPPQQQPPPPQHPQQQPPQQPQNLPINNNGAIQMNNNGGGGNPRKPMYGQNQNPRGNYGVPNNPYHDRRSNYDPRGRGPPPNQYNNPNSHNEARRMDGNDSRPQRMPSKPGMERRGGGRDDPNKLKEFSSTFRLQGPGEQSGGGGRRMSNNPPPQHPAGGNMNTMAQPPLNPNNTGPHSGPSRNISPPSAATQAPRTNNKEDASVTGNATPNSSTPTSSDVTDKGQSSSGKSAPTQTGNISSAGSPGPPSASTAASIQAANESTPPGGGMSVDNQTPSSVDSKNSDLDSKKKFTFNPNAKEFNPSAKSFSSRSPSTPPRPPSTPAQPSTPQQQMMPAQPMHSYIPMQMVYAAQPYPQTAALTPSSNSSASSGGNTPRHAGHRKVGAGMLGGVPPRSDMTPPIQMTAGPPLIAPPGTMQASAAPPQFAFVPQHYQQVMRVTAINQMYPGDGSGAAQMHQQVQYLHNGGAPNPNPGGHPNNSSQPNNPSAPTPLVPANGQGYGQAGGNHGGAPHVGYPLGVVPFMGYPHPQQMILPYVAHSHQGGAAVLPQSQ